MSSPECDGDDLSDVFFGPPSEVELERARQSQRRRTLLELPSPVARRVQNMAVRSFVVVPPANETEPPTPAKVFEIASPSLDRYQMRWHSALMREIASERYWESGDEEQEERPRVRSFVRVRTPEAACFEAAEEQLPAIACGTVELLCDPSAGTAVPCREATPAKLRVATTAVLAAAIDGAARARAMQFVDLLAQRTALLACSEPVELAPFRKSDFGAALRFLSAKQQEAVGVAGA